MPLGWFKRIMTSLGESSAVSLTADIVAIKAETALIYTKVDTEIATLTTNISTLTTNLATANAALVTVAGYLDTEVATIVADVLLAKTQTDTLEAELALVKTQATNAAADAALAKTQTDTIEAVLALIQPQLLSQAVTDANNAGATTHATASIGKLWCRAALQATGVNAGAVDWTVTTGGSTMIGPVVAVLADLDTDGNRTAFSEWFLLDGVAGDTIKVAGDGGGDAAADTLRLLVEFVPVSAGATLTGS